MIRLAFKTRAGLQRRALRFLGGTWFLTKVIEERFPGIHVVSEGELQQGSGFLQLLHQPQACRTQTDPVVRQLESPGDSKSFSSPGLPVLTSALLLYSVPRCGPDSDRKVCSLGR